ncbi:19297_t:CDS:1 [Funneliformis geosporum]|uniref:15050_t:CDS:1 n=1 Tax=Funneliformis geosporum TaxID=1117311 RepID=A0A9W4SMU8_9GLOM|nr:19297_t:CDS:1 [Funneliformis geosporum]CAI2175946.1 15050_t:CDS:1 [Funneliformis geosporum]
MDSLRNFLRDTFSPALNQTNLLELTANVFEDSWQQIRDDFNRLADFSEAAIVVPPPPVELRRVIDLPFDVQLRIPRIILREPSRDWNETSNFVVGVAAVAVICRYCWSC